MSDEIKPGDVVICIDAKAPERMCAKQRPLLGRIKQGGYYRVAALTSAGGILGLELENVDHRPADGWRASRFRKIKAADERFIECLLCGKDARPHLPAALIHPLLVGV